MPGDAALDQVHLAEHAVTTGAVFDQLAVAHHRPQPPPQRLAILGIAQLQGLTQLLVGQWPGAGRQPLQDVFPTRDRRFIALRLAFRLGIRLEVPVAHKCSLCCPGARPPQYDALTRRRVDQ
jgi:hypothetical protein